MVLPRATSTRCLVHAKIGLAAGHGACRHVVTQESSSTALGTDSVRQRPARCSRSIRRASDAPTRPARSPRTSSIASAGADSSKRSSTSKPCSRRSAIHTLAGNAQSIVPSPSAMRPRSSKWHAELPASAAVSSSFQVRVQQRVRRGERERAAGAEDARALGHDDCRLAEAQTRRGRRTRRRSRRPRTAAARRSRGRAAVSAEASRA